MTFRKTTSRVFVALVLILCGVGLYAYRSSVSAATIITVNSTADSSANDGACTLREAITAANSDTASGAAAGECAAGSGAGDTINFSISGATPHTIQPTSSLPAITTPLTINGYSEPDASVNTAATPAGLNGTLVVQLDGTNAGVNGSGLFIEADNVTVRGLVINRYNDNGIYIQNNADNAVVAGNYIGTSTSGNTGLGNADFGVYIASGTNNTVGGTSAADRNVISDNNDGVHIQGDAADSNLILGNVIGLGANGTTALGNDDDGVDINSSADGNIIGGSAPGSKNVISSNAINGVNVYSSGTNSTTVLGNYIGLASDGSTDRGNGTAGVVASASAGALTIGDGSEGARNIISGNGGDGVAFNNGGATSVVRGNYIGTNAAGTAAVGNGLIGVTINTASNISVIGNVSSGNGGGGLSIDGDNAIAQGNYIGVGATGGVMPNSTLGASNPNVAISANNVLLGGTTAAARNVISGSGSNNFGVTVLGNFDGSYNEGVQVQGNYIGTNIEGKVESGYGNSACGIVFVADIENSLVGGVAAGSGNTIAGNGCGVGVIGGALDALNDSILGNSIHSNSGGAVSTLGIDLFQTADFSSFTNAGVTPNDVGDPDGDTNHYMNFPVLSSVSSTNGQASITYSLDINNSETGATGYRIEFFANDAADPSGHGEGQTFLGADTVSGDVTNRSVTLTLPAGVAGAKYITATTTMTDASSDGFGHTSEFAANLQATLVAATSSGGAGSLADTGTSHRFIQTIAVLFMISALGVIALNKLLDTVKR